MRRKGPAQGDNPTSRKRLTHTEFYMLCEELRRRKSTIVDVPRMEQVSILRQALGFHVTAAALRDAAEATGIDLGVRKASPTSDLEKRVVFLEQAIRYLAWEIPDVSPATLEDDVAAYTRRTEQG